MYKHILVAVDGSDTSNLALQEAMKLAKERQAALRLVHVVDETPTYMTTDTAFALGDFQKAMREAGQKVLATCAATARQAESKSTRNSSFFKPNAFATQSLKRQSVGRPILSSSAPTGGMDLIACCLAAPRKASSASPPFQSS